MVGSMIVMSIYGLATVGAMTAGMVAAAFAINFAVSMIVSRVFADNPEQQQDMGVRQQVPPSAVNAVPIAYGTAYMGGTFVDAVLTEDQKTMYYVLAVSSISPNGQFAFDRTDMYYGDRLIGFDSTDLTKVISLTDEAGNVDTKISGNLYISLYTSTAGGTITSTNGAAAPSTVMGGSDINSAQRWTGTRQMNGLAFAIIKLVYNRDADTTQLQPITFKVSHTLNGTGVAKAGDVWYDYITNSVYGGAVETAFVNSTSATALNTYGDELITFTNSSGAPSTQPRYRINGVLDAGQSVLSNIDRIMSSCDSWLTYNAALGQWSVVINKAESASYAFNDNNIIGEIRVSATDITSSINQIEARFPFKENRDQAAFINIETPSGLLYPNEPVNKYSITYDLVNDSVQAHYLANRLLEQAREDLIVSFSTTYYGIQVEAGDVVSVTNSDYGWNAKLFRVMKVNEASLPDGSLGAKVELNEYNAAVYDDQNITQFAPVSNSGLSSPVYFSALTAPTATGFPSATVPNISVQVFIPVTGRVTFVNLFFTTSATPSPSDWKLLTSASTSNSQPIGNNFNYTFTNITLNTGTYYFAYLVGNEVGQSILSAASSSFSWSPIANVGPFADISGVTTFSKSGSGVITPSTATLTAVVENITSPTYAWTITGATPSSGTASSIVITPTSGATSVTATLVINGSNLVTAITRSVTMAIVNSGTTGASARVMFARIASNPVPVTGTVTVSGDNRPTGSQGSAVWGASFNVTWYANDPNPSSNDSLYQSDGIYDGTNTAWSTPYISALRVGQLSAVSTNTGSLTVDSSGYIRSGQTAFNTGTGFWIGNDSSVPKFSIGNPSGNYLAWDGTNLIIKTAGTNVTLTGVQNGGSFSDEGLGSSPTNTIAEVEFLSNGTVTGYNSGALGNWYNPTTTAIGNSYWIRFTQLTFPDPNLNNYGAPLNVWNAMSSTVTVGVDSTVTGYHTATFFYQISSASDGSSIVASGNVVVSVLLDV